MTPANANHSARELIKAYVEHQNVHYAAGDSAKSTGTEMAEMLIGMHEKLYAYFLKVE